MDNFDGTFQRELFNRPVKLNLSISVKRKSGKSVRLTSRFAIVLILILVQHCNTDSFSGEDEKYSEENQLADKPQVYRLSISNNSEFSKYDRIIGANGTQANISSSTPEPDELQWTVQSNDTAEAQVRMDSVEIEENAGAFEIGETNSIAINSAYQNFTNTWPYTLKTSTGLNEDGLSDPDISIPTSVLLNRKGEILFSLERERPASLDGESNGSEMMEFLKRTSKLKHRRVTSGIKASDATPASSLQTKQPQINYNANNVSLKATFLTPDTEESSSVELELSVKSGQQSDDNHQTQIQIVNPDNKCVKLANLADKKRVLMNVWSYSGNRLKLESQKEVPPWVLDGTLVRDGQILNRAEIPESVVNLVGPALAVMGQQARSENNKTIFNKLYFPGSSEKLFNLRKHILMLHYVLWGDQAKSWKNMLDTTVEGYLKNYIAASSRSRSIRDAPEKPNWRKMRNVLLSFMSSPELNCTTAQQNPSSIIERDETMFYPNSRPRPNSKPFQVNPPGYRPRPQQLNPPKRVKNKNRPLNTRDGIGGGGGGGYGWQTNNGWGVQQQQHQQQGWGVQESQGWEEPQGWGWGDEGGGKKEKKKKKKKKKKAKKKKKKAKKKAKKKKKKQKKKGGHGGGWGGWRPKPQQGWGGGGGHGGGMQHHGSMDIDGTELLQNALTLWGLISLKGVPVLLLIAAGVIIYLLSNKHSHPAQVVYSVPSRGWRRRTEKPLPYKYDYYSYDQMGSASTLHPDPYDTHRYYYNYNSTTPYYSSPSTSNTHSSGWNDIKTSASNASKSQLQSPSTSFTTAAYQYQSKEAKAKGKKDSAPVYYEDDYDYETEYYNRQRVVPKTRTKQEEELLKILSKHKKETVQKLLQKWKLSKMKEKSWS